MQALISFKTFGVPAQSWMMSMPLLLSPQLLLIHICSINSGTNPLQTEVCHQMGLSAFVATIAEYNDRNGNFDDK